MKINCVLMRGVNDDELAAFVQVSLKFRGVMEGGYFSVLLLSCFM
mgnify:FL=1